jgi:hypothetical protein
MSLRLFSWNQKHHIDDNFRFKVIIIKTKAPSALGLNRFWSFCLVPLVVLLPTHCNDLTFQSFDFERTWWGLFQSFDFERTWWGLFQSFDFERTWWGLFQSFDFERTWWGLFQSFDVERTWWGLFQKHAVYTKLDIYVFMNSIYTQLVVKF